MIDNINETSVKREYSGKALMHLYIYRDEHIVTGRHHMIAHLALASTYCEQNNLELYVIPIGTSDLYPVDWQQEAIESFGFKVIQYNDYTDISEFDLILVSGSGKGLMFNDCHNRSTNAMRTFVDSKLYSKDITEKERRRFKYYERVLRDLHIAKILGIELATTIIDPLWDFYVEDSIHLYHTRKCSRPTNFVQIYGEYLRLFQISYPFIVLDCPKVDSVYGVFTNPRISPKRSYFLSRADKLFDNVHLDCNLLPLPDYLAKQSTFTKALVTYSYDDKTISYLRVLDALAMNVLPVIHADIDDIVKNFGEDFYKIVDNPDISDYAKIELLHAYLANDQ